MFGDKLCLPVVEVGICLGEMSVGEAFYALNAYPEGKEQYASENQTGKQV